MNLYFRISINENGPENQKDRRANFKKRFRPNLHNAVSQNAESEDDAEPDADGFHLDCGCPASFDATSETSPIQAVPLSLFSNRRLGDRRN